MKPILIAGSSIVTLALISYSIAIITEQRKALIPNWSSCSCRLVSPWT